MSDGEGKGGENKGSSDAILKDAIAEFESFMSKNDDQQADKPRRGANQVRSKSVLGRGLSALMTVSSVEVPAVPQGRETPLAKDGSVGKAPINGEVNERQHGARFADTIETSDAPLEGGLAYLPIERISPNPKQPRQDFKQEEVESLSRSIKESGLLQPIIVRRVSSEPGVLASYEIVAGERRWRAAGLAGLGRVPALIRQLSDKETLELSIVENIQRENLNPIEEALAFQRLISEFGATQDEVAESVGKNRSSIANALRLLKLAPEVLQLVRDASLSAGHGRALLMCETEDQQIALAERVLASGLSVRETEVLATSPSGEVPLTKPPVRKNKFERTPTIIELEERFRRALGTKVVLAGTAEGGGELRIAYFSQSELESLLERLDA